MKRIAYGLATLALCVLGVHAYALFSVSDQGDWPTRWPKQMEPLREQSATYIGPMFEQQQHVIPFDDRAAFEAAWPHILKVKTPGAPIILRRGPHTSAGSLEAGVRIHCPPAGTDRNAFPEAPTRSEKVWERWAWTNFIELIVDGEVVDLNHVPLPADTPIVDLRFDLESEATPKAESQAPPTDPPPPATTR